MVQVGQLGTSFSCMWKVFGNDVLEFITHHVFKHHGETGNVQHFSRWGKMRKVKWEKNASHPHSDQCIVFLRCLSGLQHNLSKHSSGTVESSPLKKKRMSQGLWVPACLKIRVRNFDMSEIFSDSRSNETWTSSHMSTWTSRLYPNFWGENPVGNRRDTWKTKRVLNVWHCYQYSQTIWHM